MLPQKWWPALKRDALSPLAKESPEMRERLPYTVVTIAMTKKQALLNGMGLQTQLTLMATMLIMLTTALGSFLTVSATIREARDQAVSNAIVYAEAASRGTNFGLTTQNPTELAKSVAFLAEVPIIAGVEVRNANGNQIYREMFEDLPRTQLLRAKTDIHEVRLNPFGTAEVYRISTPVYSKTNAGDNAATAVSDSMRDRLIGTVDTIVNLGHTQHRLRNSIVVTLLSSAVIAIFGGFFSFFAAKRILQPVRDLLVGLKKVSEGNFSHKLPTASARELKQLIDGFNVMVDGLGHYRRETLRAREILEHRVEERTQQLFDEKERAEAASRTKSEFLARMSHEIRTPMNGVLGMTELLLMAKLGDSERRYAQTIQNSGAALLEIINDILDFSKIEAGRMELDQTPFSVPQLIEEVASIVSGNTQDKQIDLALDIDPSIEGAHLGDPGRLRQVLVNLTGNAIKFTEEGEVVIRVRVTEGQTGDEAAIRFSVEDTGIGIHADKLESIFESFNQEDGSTTRRFGGTGLGLAISRQLVELMDGDIQVHSEVGVGSKFSFTLHLPIAETTQPTTEPDLSDVRVVLVGVTNTHEEILKNQLTHWSAKVDAWGNLTQAQSALKHDSAPIDMALIDDRLPAADMPKVLALLSSANARVLYTADDSVTNEIAAQRGFEGVIHKPMVRDVLVSQLQSISALDDSALTQTLTRESSANSNLAAVHVLVVEDNRVNQRVTRAMLDKLGATHALAENGTEAVELCRENTFDLVLMDCQMPEMDGFTATGHIRNHERTEGIAPVPIIALTANALQGDDQKCFDAGMDDYMTKPFAFEELRQRLARWTTAQSTADVA